MDVLSTLNSPLGFNLLCSEESEACRNVDPEYLGMKLDLIEAYKGMEALEVEFNKALNAYNFLKTHKVDKSFGMYICDTFGLESITGLPRELHYTGDATVCTEICLEGLGSFLVETVKKIVQFFINLFNTIMRFFGIKSNRQKATEYNFQKIERRLHELDDIEFSAAIKQDIKCSVETMRIEQLKEITTDLVTMYELINNHKDTTDIKALVSGTSGILSKLGYKVQDEYKIVFATGLPYKVYNANTALNIANELGIKRKDDVYSTIQGVKKIIGLSVDLQRRYPANLKKYANRASSIKIDPNDPESQKLHLESIKQLNEEQKCQAYLCKMIVLFLELSDLLCARSVSTLKSLM